MNKTGKRDNTYCCVPQCTSRGSKNPELSFHLFPNEKSKVTVILANGNKTLVSRKLEWKRVLRIGKDISFRMTVCSKHFTQEDYYLTTSMSQRARLKPYAVPSCFLPVLSTEKIENNLQKSKATENRQLRYGEINRLVNQSEKVSNSTLIENRRHNVEETFCDSMSESSTLSASISNEEEEKSDEPEIEIIRDISSTKNFSPSERKSRNLKGIRDCSGVEKNSDIEDIEKTRKKRKVDSPSPPENMLDIPEALSAQNNFDREDIFGHYVVSELRALKDNPLLYLQTKQSILEILTSAQLEYLNPE